MTNRYILVDIDNTLFDGYYMFRAIKNELETGIFSPAIYEEMQQTLTYHSNGKLSYTEMGYKCMDLYATAHADKPIDDILKVNFAFATSEAKNVRPFFRDLLSAAGNRANVVLVTSEPQTIASPLARALGVHSAVSSSLAGTFNDARQFILSGEIHTLMAPEEKVEAIKKADIPLGSIHAAFGDSISDADIIKLAKHPYAVEPSPDLRAIAVKNKWAILNGDAKFTNNDRRRLTNG